MKRSMLSIGLMSLASLAFAQQRSENVNPAEPLDATPRAGSTWLAPQAVLFENGPLTNQLSGTAPVSLLTTAAPFNYCTLGVAAVGATRVAEDFVVPAGATWNVDAITVFGYQTGATAVSINNANVRVFNGSPALPASTVLFGDITTNRFASAALTGAFRVTPTTLTATNRALQAVRINVTPALTLSAGTYWFDFAAAGTVASGPFFPFIVPAEATPTDNGNSQQFTTAWNPLAMGRDTTGACTGATLLVGPLQGLPFIVEGTVVPSGTTIINPSIAPGPINFGNLIIGQGSQRSLTFTNTGTLAGAVTCTATGAGFAVSPTGAQTIAPNASSTFTITATSSGSGPLNGSLSCVSGATTFTFALNGFTSPVTNIPTLSMWGGLGLILVLGGFAVFAMRRQS